jgi:cytochrome c553
LDLGAMRSGPGEGDGEVAAEAKMSVFQGTCATCHGAQGEGNRALMAPPIANLARWYVVEQLGKFRSGSRGSEPRDLHGQQMRAAVAGLSEGQIEEAVAELATFPFVAPVGSMEGNEQLGAELYLDQCMECHRYNGHGEIAFKSAPLCGLPDWYLSAQMTKYLDGVRGYHAEDLSGVKMREMALRPANAEQIADIIAFVNTLGEEYPVEKGQGKR